MSAILSALVWVLLAAGCAHLDRDRGWVVRATTRRTEIAPSVGLQGLEDGLSADEAVAIALAHNPRYRADLTRVDSARADLDEARRPDNPQLTLLAALGPVSAMATLLAPLESLWQVPLRSELAARTLRSVADALVQSGLDLARDARTAHAACVLAERRVNVRAELLTVWDELTALAVQRVEIGEASEVERNAARGEAALARDALRVAEADRELARAQLLHVLGLVDTPVPAVVETATGRTAPHFDLAKWMALARRARPDVHAAELALLAACARLGLERSRIFSAAAQVEGHWTKPDTLALRLGPRIQLPIFGANPGGVGRARAELDRASAALGALRQRVVLEVTQANVNRSQARASLAAYRDQILPALLEARALAEQSYALGEDSYVVVLDATRRIGEARIREAELHAQLRRAEAELERAVGARIGDAS